MNNATANSNNTMSVASLWAAISVAHRDWNGVRTEELCKAAHRRMRSLSRNSDARSVRDYGILDAATARAGYPAAL